MQQGRGASIEILDRDAVADAAAAVEKLIEEQQQKDPESFTEDVPSRQTLWRFRNRKRGTISERTFCDMWLMLQVYDEELADRFNRAVLSDVGRVLRDLYDAWILQRYGDLFYRRGQLYAERVGDEITIRRVTEDDIGDREAFGSRGRAGLPLWRWHEYQELRARVIKLAIGKQFHALVHPDRALRDSILGVRSRGFLTETRILGPLLEGPDSGFVERGWRELSDDELTRFVRAGIERERILLKRAGITERIRAVLAGELPSTR